MATIEDFDRIDMRVGRITSVHGFPEARKPASEVLLLGAPDEGGRIVLLRPDSEVPPPGRPRLLSTQH